MTIADDFIKGNNRVAIISNGGAPTAVPDPWKPILGSVDMLVVIPDMHMYVFNSVQDNFKFGCEAMLSLLDHLDTLKSDMDDQNKTLRIYQIGDIYEMRFPSIADHSQNASAAEILSSHSDYGLIINQMNGLRVHMLYGNHDFELRHFPGFRFAATEGRVYLEDGFTPSPFFENPTNPLWDPMMLLFKDGRELEAFFQHIAISAGLISKDAHYAILVNDGATERGAYPGESDYPAEIRDYYTKRIAGHVDGPDLRIGIIGHTHHPLWSPSFDQNGNGLMFIDSGAWTEGRSDFVVLTNDEMALCHYKRA